MALHPVLAIQVSHDLNASAVDETLFTKSRFINEAGQKFEGMNIILKLFCGITTTSSRLFDKRLQVASIFTGFNPISQGL